MSSNCGIVVSGAGFLDDIQMIKVRRRTLSDATWKARHHRVSQGVLDNERAATNHKKADNLRTTPGTDGEPLLTISSMNYSRPSETVIDAAKADPDGDRLMSIELTTRGVINAHLTTNVHGIEAVRRGMLTYEAINNTHDDSGIILEHKSLTRGVDSSKIWTTMTSNMAPTIKRTMAFTSLLPGFSELDRDDQVVLFKQGSFEVIVTRYTRLFTDQGMFTPDMTVVIPRQLISAMPMGELFMEQYAYADVFNKLNLTDAELGLVCAVMIANPERVGLRNPVAVQQLRIRYMQCLYIYLKNHHSGAGYEAVFHDILDVLPLSAAVNESHARKMKMAKAPTTPQSSCKSGDSASNIKTTFPDLHNEVFP